LGGGGFTSCGKKKMLGGNFLTWLKQPPPPEKVPVSASGVVSTEL
jgi:hypothetical protein